MKGISEGSIVINSIAAIVKAFKQSYEYSFLYKVVSRISEKLSVIIKESRFLKLMAGKGKSNKLLQESALNRGVALLSRPVGSIHKKVDYINNKIKPGSFIINLLEVACKKLVSLDSRFIGALMAGFILMTLAWSAPWGFGSLLFKAFCAAVLFASVLLFSLNRSLAEIFQYSLIKKTIDRIFKYNV
ncbi:MAG TPA: hypothetical protein GXX49_05790 [Clostridiaceae bacterium]|jgi:hypothetical protein|nr:hypothetical protein [Clostridiaceae bacterium]